MATVVGGHYAQFFVLSMRGDVLLFRDFRGDLVKATTQIFYRQMVARHSSAQHAAPVLEHEGVHYCHVLEGGMYWVLSTRANVSPGLALELLRRVSELVRDFCGVLSEEAIRKNFVLAYELLDEALDFGYASSTSVEELKAFVRSPPQVIDVEARSPLLAALVASKTTSSKAAHQSVAVDRRALPDEIFVDLLENVTVRMGAQGQLLYQEVAGELVIKSFIKGHPRLKVGLNEDVRIGRAAPASSAAGEHGDTHPPAVPHLGCTLDQATFHPQTQLSEWDVDRTLAIAPPEGEFALLRYRTRDAFTPPFRVYAHVEEPAPQQLDLLLRLVADYAEPTAATRVLVRVRVPRSTGSVACELSDAQHSWEWLKGERIVQWGAKKWLGGTEASLRVRLNLDGHAVSKVGAARRELGPVTVRFELPMYVCSNVQIRYLKCWDQEKLLTPHRWVRSITRAAHYEVRLDAATTLQQAQQSYR